MTKNVVRLFEQFQPSHYDLALNPDKTKMTFSGSVVIKGKKTGRPSKRITLHQKSINVSNVKVFHTSKDGKKELTIDRVNNQDKFDEVRIHTQDMVYPGEYEISLEFNGKITEPMHGLYPCYFEVDGKQEILLATQFESHHAREVFPCIDEPEAKASFDLTLKTPTGEIVIANTPVKNQSKSGDITETVFETSPVMSTYLLAFAIGNIHCAEDKTRDGITVRTWATVAQPKNSLKYANDEAVKILEFFTDYFQTPFPLKKIDQIALPDFESGAMENWGLITYREIALLADPENRSLSSEQYVSMVVAHELSHQWFGNLVTMKWWDDLWLNESFASLMEHIALDKLHPDWFQWEQYTASDVIACSSRDIFKDVQSVHVDVHHPDEISTLFDPAIVYAKGGRLLKMMLDFIGEDSFRKALQQYFKKHAYKNTVGDDLWKEMSLASGKDVNAFMNPWISKSGMPLLEVSQSKDHIELKQHRFVLDSDNDNSLWPIPLLTDKDIGLDLFNTRDIKLKNTYDTPVIFNKNGSGHMLVKYSDQPSRDYVAKAFADETLLPESRINTLNDLHLLARKGDSSITDTFDLVKSAENESRDAVWSMIARSLSSGVALVEGNDDTEKRIKSFRMKLIFKAYEKLGWDDQQNDSANTKAMRQTILSMMVASENKEAIDECVKRYNATKSVEKLPAEQRSMILCAIIKNGEEVVDDLIAEYKKSANPDVQLAICAGLTSTKNAKTAGYIIEAALGNNGFVRPQDIFRWYGYLMRNKYTRSLAWQWLKNNWQRLESMFGDSKSFEYFVVFSAMPINTKDWQAKFIEFYKPMENVIALKRNIKVAYSEIEARVQWRERDESKIEKYFS